MTPYFIRNDNSARIDFTHATASYDWGQSQDIEYKSIFNGNRSFQKLGDYADVTLTVFLWKHTEAEKQAIKALRGQKGNLYTAIGAAPFYCNSIKYDFLNSIDKYSLATLTFKSTQYV